jgi:plastocyanin domain-containing protein
MLPRDGAPVVQCRALPHNEPVVVEFTMKSSGEIGFVCGMNMLRGTVVVQ